jgi:hypothetical protein
VNKGDAITFISLLYIGAVAGNASGEIGRVGAVKTLDCINRFLSSPWSGGLLREVGGVGAAKALDLIKGFLLPPSALGFQVRVTNLFLPCRFTPPAPSFDKGDDVTFILLIIRGPSGSRRRSCSP